jgi:hypothetical protein
MHHVHSHTNEPEISSLFLECSTSFYSIVTICSITKESLETAMVSREPSIHTDTVRHYRH